MLWWAGRPRKGIEGGEGDSLEQGHLLTQRNLAGQIIASPPSTPFCSPISQLGKRLREKEGGRENKVIEG